MKKTFTRLFSLALVLVIAMSLVIPASAVSYSGSSSYMNGKYGKALKNLSLTGNQRTDIVAIAKTQLGYLEGNNSKQLAGTVAGNGNFTEYGRWYGLQDMWCQMFVSWCAARAGVSTSVIKKTASTVQGLTQFQNQSRAHSRKSIVAGSYTPKAGDIVYFKSPRNTNATNHVGIVTGYSSKSLMLYTIEGNTSSSTYNSNGGCVATHSYSLADEDNDDKSTKMKVVYVCNPKYTGSSGGGTTTPDTGSSANCYPKCSSSYTSFVDALNSIGVDSSMTNRKKIAAANGISNYTGTASQNSTLLDKLKAGKLVKPSGSTGSTPSVSYYPKCASKYTSLVDALNSIGVDSSMTNRKKIAAANGISNYTGTSSQNNTLLDKLKAGKLIKPSGSTSSTPSVTYFPKCASKYTSLVEALKSVGADSSYDYRKKIAAKNGISNYSGTASQNNTLLDKLKAGKLIKP